MSTWEERMGERTARARAKADEAEPWFVALSERFSAFAAERDGRGGYSQGHFRHTHWAHGNTVVDAATGECLGIFSIALTDDMPPPPEFCPICADFKPEEWLTAPATEETGRG